MEMRNFGPRDRSSSPRPPSAPLRDSGLPVPDVAGAPVRSRPAAASLPGRESAAPALGHALSVFADAPPRWFAEYRLRYSGDLDVLDEKH